MRHERFDRNLHEFAGIAEPEARWPGAFRRFAARIAGRLANRRLNLRDFPEAQLRDIGLRRSDIERF
jgi:uncharacterized protein YjiS (DUF1127 family)